MRTHTNTQARAGRMRAERAYKQHRQLIRDEQARQAALTPEQAAAELAATCAAEDSALAEAWHEHIECEQAYSNRGKS